MNEKTLNHRRRSAETQVNSPLDKPAQYLKGVGPRRAELLAKMGISCVLDLICCFPARYEDRSAMQTISQLGMGQIAVTRVTLRSCGAVTPGKKRRGRRIYEASFMDKTGVLKGVWFHFSEKAMDARFRPGSEWIISGKVTYDPYKGVKTIIHPDLEKADDCESAESLNLGRIVPVYPLTEGLTQKAVRNAVHSALEYVDQTLDFIPERINRKYRLPELTDSIRRIHWPGDETDMSALADFRTPEQKKLIFNEFFLIQAGLALKRRARRKKSPGNAMRVDAGLMDKIRSILPFQLTQAQARVLDEIADDMRADEPMSRLLQGDVGSGKTAVALGSALIAVRNRKQAAIMAPTELLAQQHYKNITRLLAKTKVCVELLTSGSADKQAVYDKALSGAAHIVVGTHALIQENSRFKDLGIVIIDEQHRFGVRQRAQLARKGQRPHTLIMTATPIPRTLAMTLYGDLDVSVIDEFPPGRAPVMTRIFQPSGRAKALEIIRSQTALGRQGYIICPLVEQSEKLDLSAAVTMFEQLQNNDLRELRLGLIHGRMKSSEKEEVMDRFARKEIDALVSTTVIEVGIDHPNVTVVMIESADRFGLSQLHQLRGRVGRGTEKSYCLLMSDSKPGSPAWDRLKVMERHRDGFKIATADLEQRGAGDFFGVKQSGLPEFKIGNIIRDHKILAEARQSAFNLVEHDPKLEKPENHELLKALKERWKEKFELGDIG